MSLLGRGLSQGEVSFAPSALSASSSRSIASGGGFRRNASVRSRGVLARSPARCQKRALARYVGDRTPDLLIPSTCGGFEEQASAYWMFGSGAVGEVRVQRPRLRLR
jgi:hypothetical protein